MQPQQPGYQIVPVWPADARFAFRVELPADWAQLPVPPDQVDFSNEGVSQPIAAFVAKYGVVVLTFSVRPGFGDGSVADWFRRICAADKVQTGQFAPAKAGDIPAVGAPGSQDSDAGPMTQRFLAFEQGGWLHLLMAMAPSAIWDSVTPTFDRMLASFAMTNPMPATVPLWPPGEEPKGAAVPAGGQDLSLARQVADRFFQALLRGDEAAAKALLIPHEGESVNLNTMQPPEGSGYELGEPRAEGDEVIVDAKLTGGPAGEPGPQEQSLPLVLRMVEGGWKIDMGASISRMLGVNVEEAMTQVAEGLGKAMAKGMEAFAEGLGAAEPAKSEMDRFAEAVDGISQKVLPDAKAKMSEELGKPLEVFVEWSSFGDSLQAAGRLDRFVLQRVGEAIRQMTVYVEEQEKLQKVLDRVFIRHVASPEGRACTLEGGQLELAVCLLDGPGEDGPAGAFDDSEIVEVLRQAIR